MNFVDHFGLHFHGDDRQIRLPAGFVQELKSFWVGRLRDEAGQSFQLCVAKCRMLSAQLILKPDELYDVMIYAPALAYIHSWEDQQQVSRVWRGEYLRSAFSESVSKFKQAMPFLFLLLVRVLKVVSVLIVLCVSYQTIYVIEPEVSVYCRLTHWVPDITIFHSFTRESQNCMVEHQSYVWLIKRATHDLVLKTAGCPISIWTVPVPTSWDQVWYFFSSGDSSCAGYYNGYIRFIARLTWNKLMHIINGNF